MTRRQPRGEREEQQLLEMIRAAGAPVPPGSTLTRVYHSAGDRVQGAWAWTVQGPDGIWLNVGSQWPRRKLLTAGVVVTPTVLDGETTWHVDPKVIL